MRHFTYKDAADLLQLHQGDILSNSCELSAHLEMGHPEFAPGDYSYLAVLTQSCDLARRDKNSADSDYIALAAVCPVDSFLEREIERRQRTDVEKRGHLLDMSHRNSMSNLLERLFNNNEPDYFYLHQDARIAFPASVVMLRLSAVIKASDCYDKCLNSRVLELNDTFKAKLGWLVGNIYSRVGTEDWVPTHLTKDQFQQWINRTLDDTCAWVDKKTLIAITRAYTTEQIATMDGNQIIEQARNRRPPSNRKLLLDRLSQLFIDAAGMDQKLSARLMKLIENDEQIKGFVK
jgi:hypothetical protein